MLTEQSTRNKQTKAQTHREHFSFCLVLSCLVLSCLSLANRLSDLVVHLCVRGIGIHAVPMLTKTITPTQYICLSQLLLSNWHGLQIDQIPFVSIQCDRNVHMAKWPKRSQANGQSGHFMLIQILVYFCKLTVNVQKS